MLLLEKDKAEAKARSANCHKLIVIEAPTSRVGVCCCMCMRAGGARGQRRAVLPSPTNHVACGLLHCPCMAYRRRETS